MMELLLVLHGIEKDWVVQISAAAVVVVGIVVSVLVIQSFGQVVVEEPWWHADTGLMVSLQVTVQGQVTSSLGNLAIRSLFETDES